MKFFKKEKDTKREFMPLMYYRTNEALGRIVGEDEFSKTYADKIVLFCKRLHEMGAFEEDKIIRFHIGSMVDMLVELGALKKMEIRGLNVAQVAFGKNYAGYWFEGKKGDPSSLFMVPEQIAFYHSEKEDNYYLSLLYEGLDLCKNKVSDSNIEDWLEKAGRGSPAYLSITGMSELQSAFHILFVYLKYKILIQAEKRGYYAFLQTFANAFCEEALREEFVDYAKQYFSLNEEKKRLYPMAHQDLGFADFLDRLSTLYRVGLSSGISSFASFSLWLKLRCNLAPDHKAFQNFYEYLCEADDLLAEQGKALYILNADASFFEMTLLVGDASLEFHEECGIKLKRFAELPKENYAHAIELENRVRSLARQLYAFLGVPDAEGMMALISGLWVLDRILYEEDYLLYLEPEEHALFDLLPDFLEKHGLASLMKDLRARGWMDAETSAFEEGGWRPDERMLPLAEELKKRGKVLVSMEIGAPSYAYTILEDTETAREQFAYFGEELKKLREIIEYAFLDEAGTPSRPEK